MYNTEELEQKALKAIEDKKLFFIEDIVANLPCSKDTFYKHFPVESDGYKRISEALERVKSDIKVSMRSKWYTSKAPALQISLYKLIASTEERRALNSQTIDFEIPEDTEIKIKISR